MSLRIYNEKKPNCFIYAIGIGWVQRRGVVSRGVYTPEPPTNPDVTLPELPDITRPTHYSAVIKSGSQQITGAVSCNGVNLDAQGEVVLTYDEPITCLYGNVTLAEFSPIWSQQPLNNSESNQYALFELTINKADATQTKHAQSVLNKINACPSESKLCLNEIDSFDIEHIYLQLDDAEAVKAFLAPKQDDNVGKAPSSHIDYAVVPEVSTGTNDQQFGQQGAFVSANVEESFAYKPTGESAVLTTAHLKDEQGRAIVGVQFYSVSKKGTTDSQGAFELVVGGGADIWARYF